MYPFKRSSYRLIVFIAAFLLIPLACGGGGTPTPDPCSVEWLVAEINAANASPTPPGSHDYIDLAPGCLYEIESHDNDTDGYNGLPSITSPIHIRGHDATIRRKFSKVALRLFHVAPGGSLILADLTLLDGAGMEPANVIDPIRNAGGAIFNAGELELNNVKVTENMAGFRGGGIYNASSGTMNIHNSTIEGNTANLQNIGGEEGGGIYNDGDAAIYQSTISSNVATGNGGAIYNEGYMTLINDTVSGNQSTLGSAIRNVGTMSILFTTISDNSAEPAMFSSLSSLEISASIVANNSGVNCQYPSGAATTGENLDNDGSCSGFTITANPMLAPLANNGGPTRTHALLPPSPAIDALPGSCPASDQRGVSRPQGAHCDLGAYESEGPFIGPIGIATLHITPIVITPYPFITPTPTFFLEPVGTIPDLTLCRVGPGDPYDVVSSLQPGTQVELLGTGEGGGYLVVTNPRYNLPCWVREADVDTGGFDVFSLPVIKIPPLPTKTPTAAPLGCMVPQGLAAGPRCVSPCPDPKKYPDTCTP